MEIRDLSRLVLLFGPNAAGKSNLLDALDLLGHLASEDTLTAAFQKHRGNRLKRPLPVRWFFHGNKDGSTHKEMRFEIDLHLHEALVERINSELEQREIVADLERSYTRVTQSRLRYSLSIEYLPKARTLHVVEETLTPLRKDWTPYSTDQIIPYIRVLKNPQRLSVKLERQAHPRLYDIPRSRTLLSEIRDAVNHPHLVAVSEELRSLRVYYVEPGEARTSVNDIEARDPGPNGEQLASFYHWLKREHNPVFRNLVINLKNIVRNVDGLKVEEGTEGFLELWVEEVGAGSFPAALISEGTLRLLCILGIAATPEPPAIVGYEEPENGVNPSRLREMLSILENAASSSSGTQFFLTTHSPTVIDYFEDASLIFCEQHQNGSAYIPWQELPLFRRHKVEMKLGSEQKSPSGLGERFSRGDFG